MNNNHLWEAFNNYIDMLVNQQHKALEQTDNNVIMYRSQGAIASLRRLKLLRKEVNKNE